MEASRPYRALRPSRQMGLCPSTNLTTSRRMTVLFVTHDLDEAITLADRVVEFSARPGRVREIRDIGLPRLHRVLSPYIAALYAMPKIALAPLFIIAFGIGIESRVALVAITVFFLLLNATLDGVRDVDRDLIQQLESIPGCGFRFATRSATRCWRS